MEYGISISVARIDHHITRCRKFDTYWDSLVLTVQYNFATRCSAVLICSHVSSVKSARTVRHNLKQDTFCVCQHIPSHFFAASLLNVFAKLNLFEYCLKAVEKPYFGPPYNYKTLYTVLSCLGVFTFCTCCKILICLVCFVASFKLSFV